LEYITHVSLEVRDPTVKPDEPSDMSRENTAQILFCSMLCKIIDFVRVESETIFIVGKVFERLSQTLYHTTTTSYQRDTVTDPQRTLGAQSAMTEVPLSL